MKHSRFEKNILETGSFFRWVVLPRSRQYLNQQADLESEKKLSVQNVCTPLLPFSAGRTA